MSGSRFSPGEAKFHKHASPRGGPEWQFVGVGENHLRRAMQSLQGVAKAGLTFRSLEANRCYDHRQRFR
jgi:hypothetical protein